MIAIERWLDVLSFVVMAGIIGTFLFSMRKSGVRRRSLSEKPALFLEFTGKQVSVRRKKSKIVPSYREPVEACNIEAGSPAAGSGLIQVTRTLVGLKDTFLVTTRDSFRILLERKERVRILMTATGRQTSVTAARVFAALRARIDIATRPHVVGLLKQRFSGGVQERLTEIRQRVAGPHIARLGGLRRELRFGHSWEQAMRRLRQSATDVLLYIDYRWYRLERSLQSQSKQFKAVTSRLAKTPFTEFHVIRVLMKKRNDFAARERLQGWLREANIVFIQHRQDLTAGCRALQGAARDYMRRVSETENQESAQPESVKPSRPSSPGLCEKSATEPEVLNLTSSGTLRLKSRLEDERTSIAPKSSAPMGAASKGAPSLSQVSVRYVGALQRRHGDPAEGRQSKQLVK